MKTNPLDPIVFVSEALERFGSQKNLADALGIKRPWMSQIANNKETLPPLLAHRYKAAIEDE